MVVSGRWWLLLILSGVLVTSVLGTAFSGTVYDSNLVPVEDVIVEVSGPSSQKFVAKQGYYSFSLPPGSYVLSAYKQDLVSEEVIEVAGDMQVYDLFLLGDFTIESEILSDDDTQLVEIASTYAWWRYALGGTLILFLLWRFWSLRKTYGTLASFRKKKKAQQHKTVEEHKAEILAEPGYMEEVVGKIKKHGGRLTQKQLRKEMLHLSEAKISLLLTDLEHQGKIEKVKKGRGNVILWKSTASDTKSTPVQEVK